MSGKLDQSLDEILSTRRAAARGRGRGRGARRAPATRAAPTGGIQKNTRAASKATSKAATTSTAGIVAGKDTKIIVNNLPHDVNEGQIKEYFSTSVGPVRGVSVQYGPTGTSRGIATITFKKPGAANLAMATLSDVRVEGKLMRLELVVDATRSQEPVKKLSDRVTSKGHAQPKPAAGPKKVTENATRGRGGTRARGRRGRNAGRPKAKTADQLDAEMTDYFAQSNGGEATTNGTAAPANDGDAAMDEIS